MIKRIPVCALLVLLPALGAAHASVAFDVAVGLNVNEDTRIFLNVSNQVWHPTVATTIISGCPDPEDDFPVVAFLAYHSRRNPTFVLNLRNEGYSWSDIFFQLNVSPNVLFVGIDRDPGPPYGKAWGYWKKHHRPGARVRYRLADRDVVSLVKVQTVSRHFGTSPFSVIKAHQDGRRPEIYTASRWREKHGRNTWSQGRSSGQGPAKSGKPGRGGNQGSDQNQGPGKGKGKGKGPHKGSQ